MKTLIKALCLSLVALCAATLAEPYEEIIYYHNDALGSPIMATDQNGDVLWREEYTPYGSRLTYEARELDCSTSPCTPIESQWDEKIWYTGKPEETRLGINYFGARWYDPELGRFLSQDPVGFDENNVQSFNRYAYANNNPYAFIDLDGRSSISVHFKDQKIHYSIAGVKGILPQSISDGHSGVVAINDKSGLTKYREFGRYNGTSGDIRGSVISNFELDKNGVPTADSIGLVLRQLQQIGKRAGSSDIEITFRAGGDFDAMLKEFEKWDGKTWTPFGATCHSFCGSVVEAGGSNGASVSGKLSKENSGLIKDIRNLYHGSDQDKAK